jgi:hypothetical protein
MLDCAGGQSTSAALAILLVPANRPDNCRADASS